MYKIQIMTRGNIVKKDLNTITTINTTQQLKDWYIIIKFNDTIEGYYCILGQLVKANSKELINDIFNNTKECFDAFMQNIKQKKLRNELIKEFLNYPKNIEDYDKYTKRIKSFKFMLLPENKHNQLLLMRMNSLRSRQIKFINGEV